MRGQGKTSGGKWRGGRGGSSGSWREGEERWEHPAARPRLDAFKPAERDWLGGSLGADILVVSEDEGEEARRMAVEGGQRQPMAPNVPAAAMKSILPEVRKKEEGKGTRGRTGAGAAEGGDSGVRTGGREQTGKGEKGQVGRQGQGRRQGTRKGQGDKGVDRSVHGRSPNNRLATCCRSQPHRSAQRCGRRRRGWGAASRRRGMRRWRTWSASAVAARLQSLRPTPSNGWRWGQRGEDRIARLSRRGQEGGTAANPVADPTEGKGRLRRAAKQRRGAAASGREAKRVEGSEGGRQERAQ